MLRTADLIEWFEDQGITVPFSMQQLPDGAPHRAYAVAISGGLGLETEQVLDRPSFTVLTRGANGGDAEDLAVALDAVWLNATSTFDIGSSNVVGKGRLGGPPAFVAYDDKMRAVFAATYWCRIKR